MQPDVTESGRVYFLGDQYVDKVEDSDGTTIYNRNLIIGTSSDWYVESIEGYQNFFIGDQAKNVNKIKPKDKLTYSVEDDNSLEKVENFRVDAFANMSVLDKSIKNLKGNYIESGNTGISTLSIDVPDTMENINIARVRKEHYKKGVSCTVGTRKHKLELGTKRTPYTIAPEDLFPSTSTLPAPGMDWEGDEGGMMIERG